jgi:hypothetical protein
MGGAVLGAVLRAVLRAVVAGSTGTYDFYAALGVFFRLEVLEFDLSLCSHFIFLSG